MTSLAQYDFDATATGIQPKDAALLHIIEEVLRDDEQLAALPCEITVNGGVVHVTGTVPMRAARERIRRKLARIRGVRGVWDVIRVASEPPLKVIDIGCGPHKQNPSAIGIDYHQHADVDLVTNLEAGLPFDDNEIDYVFAVHFLEHVSALPQLMNEIHRVLKPGGVLHAMVPESRSTNAVADPTHVRQFNLQTFRYFCERRSEVSLFRPLCAASDNYDVLADLQPVKPGEEPPSEQELALFFA